MFWTIFFVEADRPDLTLATADASRFVCAAAFLLSCNDWSENRETSVRSGVADTDGANASTEGTRAMGCAILGQTTSRFGIVASRNRKQKEGGYVGRDVDKRST